MTHPTPKMIAIDMDGTLVHPGGTVTELNHAAIERARAAGAQIVIATGRRHNYAMQVLRGAALHRDDVVLSSNGTLARTIAGKLIFRNPIPLETAQALCASLGPYRNAFVLTYDLIDADGNDLPGSLVMEDLDHLHGSIFGWMEANQQWIRRVEPVESSLPASGEEGLPIQAMLCGAMDRMLHAEATLKLAHGDRLSLHRTEYPARDLCIVDILPAGCSKGSGLQHLLAAEGMSPHDLLAIGDNWNDLPMFELAGYAAVMGNAPEPLRTLATQRGWTVTAHHHEGGVAEAISRFFPADGWGKDPGD